MIPQREAAFTQLCVCVYCVLVIPRGDNDLCVLHTDASGLVLGQG